MNCVWERVRLKGFGESHKGQGLRIVATAARIALTCSSLTVVVLANRASLLAHNQRPHDLKALGTNSTSLAGITAGTRTDLP